MAVAALSVIKARKPIGKRGEPGRFVTLKTGRVIFLPEGRRTKWADVKEKIMASKKVPWGEGKVVKQTQLTSGTNPNYLVEFEDGSRAIHKINKHGFAESEVLAYEFSESIGWDIVPETALPEGAKDVTRQRWIENAETAEEQRLGRMTEEEYFFEFGEEPLAWEEDPRMRMMDLLLQNPDRHLGNIVVDENDKQWAIDNNLALSPSRYVEKNVEYMRNWTGANMEMWAKDQGMIDAAKDIAKWSGTSAYDDYVERMEGLIGGQVAEVFRESVTILAGWSGEAVAEGEEEWPEEEEW